MRKSHQSHLSNPLSCHQQICLTKTPYF